MAYLEPHFGPDVFVSYSHGDPRRGGESPLKEWTRALLRKLDGQILSLDTEFDSLDVWIDEHIDPIAHLTDELRAWVNSHRSDWPVLVTSIAHKWLDEGLHDRGITRDL